MQNIKINALSVLACGLGLCCLMFCGQATAAEPDSSIPPVLQAGFDAFQKERPEQGIDLWKEGGLVGGESKTVTSAAIFRQAEMVLGKYVAYEWITTKMIGKSSKIIYIAIKYEHGAVYARFLVYRTEKNWVVQSMNFNTRPEALMPWLAFEENQ